MKVFGPAVLATDSERSTYDSLPSISFHPVDMALDGTPLTSRVKAEWSKYENSETGRDVYACMEGHDWNGRWRFQCDVLGSDYTWEAHVILSEELEHLLPVDGLRFGDIDGDGDYDIAVKLGADIYVFHASYQ